MHSQKKKATHQDVLQNICSLTMQFYNKRANKENIKKGNRTYRKGFYYLLICIFSVSQKIPKKPSRTFFLT